MDLQQFNELWKQAETIERDLRLLLSLHSEIENTLHLVHTRRENPIPEFNMALLEAIPTEVVLLTVPLRTELRSITTTLQHIFGIAAGEERSLTPEEREKIIGHLETILVLIKPFIEELKLREAAVWEQIGQLTQL